MSGYSTINVRTNFPAIAAKLERLPEAIGNKALVRALNKTVDQGKTEMARRISGEYRIGVGEAKKRLVVHKAYLKSGVYHVQAKLAATRSPGKGRSMNLIAFVAKGRVSKASAKRQGKANLAGHLQFKIKRAGGNKVIPGAFIGNKGRTVFIRTGKARLPIQAKNTIDVPQMFNARKINEAVRKVILKQLQANFTRELRVVLQGWAR